MFCKIRRKIPIPKSLFTKFTGLYAATLLKERLLTDVFNEHCEIFKTSFFTEYPQANAFVLVKNI